MNNTKFRLSRMATVRRTMQAVAVATTSSLILTGCIFSGSSTDPAAAVADDLRKVVSDEPQTITMWSSLQNQNSDANEGLTAVIAAFNVDYPQVTVVLETHDQDEIDSRLRTLPNSTSPSPLTSTTGSSTSTIPDLVTITPGAASNDLNSQLLPLQESLSATTRANLRFINDIDTGSGAIYGVPLGSQATSLVVNPAVLAAAGIQPNEATNTFPQLLKSCQALHTAGFTAFDVAWSGTDDLLTFMGMLTTQVSTREEIRRVGVSGVPVDRLDLAQQYLVQMKRANCFDDAAVNRTGKDELNMYAGGRAGFFLTRTVRQYQRVIQSQPMSMMVDFPETPDSKHRGISYGGPAYTVAVTQATKERSAAGAFLTFLASPQGQEILYRESGIVPNLRSFADGNIALPQRAYVPFAMKAVNVSLATSWPESVRNMMRVDAAAFVDDSPEISGILNQITQATRESIDSTEKKNSQSTPSGTTASSP